MNAWGGVVICADLSESQSIVDFVVQIPPLDGLVLNAGISKVAPVKCIKEADFGKLLNINTVSPLLLLKELLRHKKLKSGASVVVTASMAAVGEVAVGSAMYAASKAALSAASKVCALELAPKNIRVNAVCPGMVHTKLTDTLSAFMGDSEPAVSHYPLGRLGEPKDVAFAIVYLLSDAASWITGTDFLIDGGLHLSS